MTTFLPLRVTWVVRQGADFDINYVWSSGSPAQAVDMGGWEWQLQARSRPSSALLVDWSSDDDDPVVTLGVHGTVGVHVDGTVTAGWSWGQAVADLDLLDGERIVPFLRADIVVVPAVVHV